MSEVRCSWCKRPLEQVAIMILSAVMPDKAICNECVENVGRVLEASNEADELEEEAPPEPKTIALADIIARRGDIA